MNRIERLVNLAAERGDFKAAIINSPQNRFYFLGMHSSAGTIVLFKDEAYFIIDSRYHELATNTVKNAKVLLQGDLYGQINELLAKHDAKEVWVEDSMTLGELNTMKARIKANIVTDSPLSEVINSMRAIKSAEEIEAIKMAQSITDKTFTHMCEFIKPGMREIDLAIELDTYMKKNGASGNAFDTILVSGTNSSRPHGVPGEKLVEKGDFVTMDFGAAYGGYCSDMTRTVAVGHASEEMEKVYYTVLKAQLMAIEAIKPGLVCEDVDKIARDYIYSNGYEGYFGHSLGHSFGIDIHERPMFRIGDKTITKAGMTLSAEPGIYIPGKFGVRIEDTVLITETGCENFTHSPKEKLIIL